VQSGTSFAGNWGEAAITAPALSIFALAVTFFALPVSILSFPVAIFVAAVISVIANTARDPKRSRVLKPSDFDPFNKPSRPVKVGVSVLKDVFIDRQMPVIPAAVKEPRA